MNQIHGNEKKSKQNHNIDSYVSDVPFHGIEQYSDKMLHTNQFELFVKIPE